MSNTIGRARYPRDGHVWWILQPPECAARRVPITATGQSSRPFFGSGLWCGGLLPTASRSRMMRRSCGTPMSLRAAYLALVDDLAVRSRRGRHRRRRDV